MKRIAIGVSVVVAAGWIAGWTTVAEARNPHCAGGIQYLTQALTDKEKGNTEDYQREISKAVQQLEMCSSEDPDDFEAIGYLAWAYAEVDSARLAGTAFTRALQGLTAKGDKKKITVAETNRDHYWSIAFNDGISKINTAHDAYPEFCRAAGGPEEQKLKDEASRQYDAAIASLQRAAWIKPGDPRTLRNLGAVYAFRCDFEQAEAVFREATKVAPNDADLAQALRDSRLSRANALIDAKKYDEAITLFSALSQSEKPDASIQVGLADPYFQRAQTWSSEKLPSGRAEALAKLAPNPQELTRLKEAVADSLRRADFKHAGEGYSKAAELKPDNPDYPFNAALAYQNAGESVLAEKWWRSALEKRPDDMDIMSSLGSVLADQKKFDEAIKVLHKAVTVEPKNKTVHRQLGSVYTKAGNNAKGTEELMVFLALQNGKPAADAGKEAAKAAPGSAGAKTLASNGPPEDIYPWEAEKEKYESWFYWSKAQAYHFKSGTLVGKSDWSAPSLKAEAATGAR